MTSADPRPRLRLPFAAILSGCGVLAGCGGAGEDRPAPRNLLVIAVDTLRADHLGAYGDLPSRTPEIDALAASGVTFEHAVSHASWTLPSFAAMLTSLYSSTHGCWNFDSVLSDAFVTFPEVLNEAGFDTYGAASHVYFDGRYGLQQGFDDFDDELAWRMKDGATPVTSHLISEKATTWLAERAASQDPDRWLLWLHYFDPHFPYIPHEAELRGADELLRYQGEIAYTDGFVGRVLAALEEHGFADDTAVLFVSDHGEAFHEHPGVRRHAKSLYREELRVPLVLRVPGIEPRRVTELVRTVDLMPTLLEVLQVRPEKELPMEGTSLLPAMLGRPHESPPLLAEIRLHDGFHANGFVRGRWKLVEDVSNGVFRLFDVENDFEEQVDLAGERPDLVEELVAEMRAAIRRSEALGELYESGGSAVLDEAERARLRDLGYL